MVIGSTSCPCNNTRTSSPLMQLPASELAVQADHAVNLEFMTERLDGTLIPYLVIKTSGNKLSTVWGHGESWFSSPGPQNALWLRQSRKTHTLGGLTLTPRQTFLVQPASTGPTSLRRGASKTWRKALSLQLTEKDQPKERPIANMKSKQFIV